MTTALLLLWITMMQGTPIPGQLSAHPGVAQTQASQAQHGGEDVVLRMGDVLVGRSFATSPAQVQVWTNGAEVAECDPDPKHSGRYTNCRLMNGATLDDVINGVSAGQLEGQKLYERELNECQALATQAVRGWKKCAHDWEKSNKAIVESLKEIAKRPAAGK